MTRTTNHIYVLLPKHAENFYKREYRGQHGKKGRIEVTTRDTLKYCTVDAIVQWLSDIVHLKKYTRYPLHFQVFVI